MNRLAFFKKFFPETAAVLITLMLAYAGIVKLLNLEKFRQELYLSPLIPASVTGLVSVLVPAGELAICFLFFRKNTMQSAFLLTYGLMLFFSAYIIFLLNYSTYIPCSCGGILGSMNWGVHVFFNLFFVLLAAAGYFAVSGRYRHHN